MLRTSMFIMSSLDTAVDVHSNIPPESLLQACCKRKAKVVRMCQVSHVRNSLQLYRYIYASCGASSRVPKALREGESS